MRRLTPRSILAVTLCASSLSFAQRGGGGVELHGPPASVTSPGPNGVPRGIAGSVTDPHFGSALRGSAGLGHRPAGGHHRQPTPVYVVPYYAYYGYPYYDYSSLDSDQPQPAQPQVSEREETPPTANDDSRYGEHYFDGRESKTDPATPEMAQPNPAPQTDDVPATTLIFRDGHKSQVHNYAIVGSNLIDLSRSPVLKKIPLDSLDLDATRKENAENGVDFHTP